MSWSLFLDDERFPGKGAHAAIISRDFYDAVALCEEKGCPNHVYFDHDLGLGPDGFDFAAWLVNEDLNKDGNFIPKDFSFSVHSMNPIGAAGIRSYLGSYLEYREKKFGEEK